MKIKLKKQRGLDASQKALSVVKQAAEIKSLRGSDRSFVASKDKQNDI